VEKREEGLAQNLGMFGQDVTLLFSEGVKTKVCGNVWGETIISRKGAKKRGGEDFLKLRIRGEECIHS